MSAPTVSIGMPVFNGAKYLQQAIDALLSQDFSDFELIISDNASTDATESICREYATKDKRVFYNRNTTNLGAAANYNIVVHLARGKFFKWAAHDDVCLPGYLSTCVRTLNEAPSSVALVYTRSSFVDEHGVSTIADSDQLETRSSRPSRRLAHVLHNVNMANSVFGLIRAESLRKTRLIDSFIASDYVLLAELALLGELHEIKQPLFERRLHRDGSRFANVSNEDVQNWFDPNRPLQFPSAHRLFPRGMVRIRLVYEWIRSVCRLPMTYRNRFECLLTVPVAYGMSRIRCGVGAWKRRLHK